MRNLAGRMAIRKEGKKTKSKDKLAAGDFCFSICVVVKAWFSSPLAIPVSLRGLSIVFDHWCFEGVEFMELNIKVGRRR